MENDTFQVQPPSLGLNKLQAIAEEYFDNYCLIVMSKDGSTWRAYNNKCTAHGMASMVVQEINRDWYQKS